MPRRMKVFKDRATGKVTLKFTPTMIEPANGAVGFRPQVGLLASNLYIGYMFGPAFKDDDCEACGLNTCVKRITSKGPGETIVHVEHDCSKELN